MPTLVSPSSSQEIVPVSSPFATTSRSPLERSTTLPVPISFDPRPELRPKIREALSAQKAREAGQNGKRKAKATEIVEQRKRVQGMDRSRATEHMVCLHG